MFNKTIGLINAAKKKNQDAIFRVEVAINQMLNNKQVINFATVSKTAKVSRAWLYKQPKFKEQIMKLTSNCPINKKISEEKKLPMYKKLQNRIKKLNNENIELKKQIEVVYGKLYQDKS